MIPILHAKHFVIFLNNDRYVAEIASDDTEEAHIALVDLEEPYAAHITFDVFPPLRPFTVMEIIEACKQAERLLNEP